MDDLQKLLESIGTQLKEVKKEKKPKRERKSEVRGNGYIYEYGESGKLQSKARRIAEEAIGRKLRDHEIVIYRDGNKENLDPDNLIVGFKAGTPLNALVCCSCGGRDIRIKNWKEDLT